MREIQDHLFWLFTGWFQAVNENLIEACFVESIQIGGKVTLDTVFDQIDLFYHHQTFI